MKVLQSLIVLTPCNFTYYFDKIFFAIFSRENEVWNHCEFKKFTNLLGHPVEKKTKNLTLVFSSMIFSSAFLPLTSGAGPLLGVEVMSTDPLDWLTPMLRNFCKSRNVSQLTTNFGLTKVVHLREECGWAGGIRGLRLCSGSARRLNSTYASTRHHQQQLYWSRDEKLRISHIVEKKLLPWSIRG